MKNLKKQNSQIFEIDAAGKPLGRLATEVATILMGKNTPEFERHLSSGHKVTVINASQLAISPKKMEEKIYTRYSGYPGGLKKENMSQVLDKKGVEEVLRRAVYGMLPGNKLRKIMMKNLEIKK